MGLLSTDKTVCADLSQAHLSHPCKAPNKVYNVYACVVLVGSRKHSLPATMVVSFLSGVQSLHYLHDHDKLILKDLQLPRRFQVPMDWPLLKIKVLVLALEEIGKFLSRLADGRCGSGGVVVVVVVMLWW